MVKRAARTTSVLWLGLLVWSLLGCTVVPAPIALLLSSPTPTLTPLPTATPTLTATATIAPSPTATATATPLPPAFTVSYSPQLPAQGQTLVVRVVLERAAALSGNFDGQILTFIYNSPTEAWALVGLPPWNEVGARAMTLRATAPDGQSVQLSRAIEVVAAPFDVQNIDVPQEQSDLLAPGLRPVEDRYILPWLRQVSGPPMWEGPFLAPTQGFRSSPFGARRSYQGGEPTGYHGGLDFAAAEGTPIYAPANGVIIMIEPLRIRGNFMLIDHGAGVHTLYYHLFDTEAVVGQQVARGDLIGLMGTTGLSTGPHLHWEVRIGDVFVDPDEWLERDFRLP